ncbi:hypothetical protein ACFVJS_03845 [Nocardioides sp. NPDC057772]|uniref:hypothetical protein n=1 Tax=Nocardioides sp. NPDC057772 TaxID=3346245 RepID=UPI00366F7F39
MSPKASVDYYRRQQNILFRLLLALRLAWRQMDPKAKWPEQYAEDGIAAQIALLVSSAQVAAATEADAYLNAVLAELALAEASDSKVLAPAAFAGVAGSGVAIEDVLGITVPRAGQAFNRLRATTARRADVELEQARRALSEAEEAAGRAPADRRDLADDAVRQAQRRITDLELVNARTTEENAQAALDEAETFLEHVASTILADTARAAEKAALATRNEAEGWVRMLNLPSCPRCIVQAGQFFRWNDGFERHPLCDCKHIPASEAIAGDLTLDADAYFHSLSREDQDLIFGRADAEAIRLGADISQVVNAHRGMQVAQVFDKDVAITLEGTTRRGLANQALTTRRRNTGGTREAGAAPIRLMPETILAQARDRDDATRLLALHGYIL